MKDIDKLLRRVDLGQLLELLQNSRPETKIIAIMVESDDLEHDMTIMQTVGNPSNQEVCGILEIAKWMLIDEALKD